MLQSCSQSTTCSTKTVSEVSSLQELHCRVKFRRNAKNPERLLRSPVTAALPFLQGNPSENKKKTTEKTAAAIEIITQIMDSFQPDNRKLQEDNGYVVDVAASPSRTYRRTFRGNDEEMKQM